MDIKCNINPNYFQNFPENRHRVGNYAGATFQGAYRAPQSVLKENVDKFVKRPVGAKRAAGLLSINPTKEIKQSPLKKIVAGINSIDAITHDADKMIMYLLGFPKSFVSDFHRKHSMHHPESGKKMNLRSMLCDNIASSPEFKPEKQLSLREHFKTSKLLQNVTGFKDILEKYNYGENINFDKINKERQNDYTGLKGLALVACKFILFGLF